MRIQSTNSIYFKHKNTYNKHQTGINGLSFSGFIRKKEQPLLETGQYIDTATGQIYNRHKTQWARNDLDWGKFQQYLKQKYKAINNVDIIIFGCSTGEEAYTMAIILDKLYPNSKPKIKAFDIDEETIKKCNVNKNHGIAIDEYELDGFECRLNMEHNEICRYFQEVPFKYKNYYKLNNDILQSVEFKKANIITSLDIISSSRPTILMARNMWPYINPQFYQEFADKLYEKMSPNSIVVIGRFDRLGTHRISGTDKFPDAMRKVNFEHPSRVLQNGEEFNSTTRRLIFEKLPSKVNNV